MKKNLNLYKKVNLLENPPLIQLLSRLSLGMLLLLLVAIGYRIMDQSMLQNDFLFFYLNKETSWMGIFLFFSGKSLFIVVLFFLSLILHEAIHGLFFILFGAEKVTFGFKKGLAYAEAEGSYFQPWQFNVIALTPFLFLSLLYLLLAQYDPISAWLLVALHTSGCVGDFYFVYLLIKLKKIDLIEDTKTGINLYKKS